MAPVEAVTNHPSGLITAEMCLCFLIWLSVPKRTLQACLKKMSGGDLPQCTVAYVLRVVSRLQGDSLSESRSEEERRPHVAEQAVPDISCKFHSAAAMLRSHAGDFCALTPPLPSFLLRSSVAWGGHVAWTIAGMRGLISGVVLCEYPSANN